MLLQRLVEYYQRLPEAVPPGYQRKAVRWLVDLNASGQPRSIVPTLGKDTGKGGKARGKEMVAPHVMRSSGVSAALLVDRADYALGLAGAPSSGPRLARCHEAFVRLVKECADATGEPDVQAVARCLDTLAGSPPNDAPKDMSPSDLVAFRVDGRLPSDLPKVRAFWAEKVAAQRTSRMGQCLVCGKRRPIAERHTVKIKGIPDGQPSVMALVSANAEAFESYGLAASLTAPTCLECAEAYATAANSLYANEATHLNVGRVSYRFWTRQPASQGIFRALSAADPEDVKRLLASAAVGRPRTLDEANRYYAVALSASGGRVAVREWLEGSVEEAQRHLVHYFLGQRLARASGEQEYFRLSSLADSLAPQRTRPGRNAAGTPPPNVVSPDDSANRPTERTESAADIPPNAVNALMRAALKGAPLPEWMLFEAVRRNKAERAVTRPRAALTKLILMSRYQEIDEEGNMATDDQKNPAYLCGRLLRVLEHAQQEAVSPGKTLIDRYYGSASSAPGSVFGLLFRNAQAHLAKLRTDKPGLHTLLQKDLSEVMAGLEGWPRTLTLREQALFALGYYHQRTKDFTPRGGKGGESEGESP